MTSEELINSMTCMVHWSIQTYNKGQWWLATPLFYVFVCTVYNLEYQYIHTTHTHTHTSKSLTLLPEKNTSKSGLHSTVLLKAVLRSAVTERIGNQNWGQGHQRVKIIRANVVSLFNTTDFWSDSALQNNHFNKSVFVSCLPVKIEANLCNNI